MSKLGRNELIKHINDQVLDFVNKFFEKASGSGKFLLQKKHLKAQDVDIDDAINDIALTAIFSVCPDLPGVVGVLSATIAEWLALLTAILKARVQHQHRADIQKCIENSF